MTNSHYQNQIECRSCSICVSCSTTVTECHTQVKLSALKLDLTYFKGEVHWFHTSRSFTRHTLQRVVIWTWACWLQINNKKVELQLAGGIKGNIGGGQQKDTTRLYYGNNPIRGNKADFLFWCSIFVNFLNSSTLWKNSIKSSEHALLKTPITQVWKKSVQFNSQHSEK